MKGAKLQRPLDRTCRTGASEYRVRDAAPNVRCVGHWTLGCTRQRCGRSVDILWAGITSQPAQLLEGFGVDNRQLCYRVQARARTSSAEAAMCGQVRQVAFGACMGSSCHFHR